MDVNTVEQNVDATRDAAERVLRARERAMKIENDSMSLIYEDLDEWQRYKKAKGLLEEIDEVEQDARSAGIKANECRLAVIQAIGGHSGAFARCAREAAEKAYEQSRGVEEIVRRLAGETRKNCKDACPQLR